jgi:hypothetical protein
MMRLLALLAGALLLQGSAVKTGPAVGDHIPDFQATDQDGQVQTFASLRGPNGLVLMFIRSADW